MSRAWIPAAVGAVWAVLAALLWSTTLQRIEFEHRQEIHRVQQHTANLALAFERNVASTLKSADHILFALARDYRGSGRTLAMEHLIEEGFIDSRLFGFAGIADAQGRVVLGTGRDFKVYEVGDRKYFRAAVDHPVGGTVVGEPVIGRISGRPVLPFARRISDAKGGLLGVAIVTTDPRHFSEFYGEMDLGRGSLVQLVGLDGVVRARWDDNGASHGQDMRESTLLRAAAASDWGTFLSRGILDNDPRYISFRVLRDAGVVVAVGASVKETLAAFEQRRTTYVASSVAVSVLLLLLAAAVAIVVRGQAGALEVEARANARLAAQLEELRRFERVTIDRELRMVELKEQIARLSARSG